MPTIRKMKPAEVQDASLLSRKVMKDSWERFEKDIYPREALEFDLSQHSPENYTNSLKNQSHFNFVAEENKKLIGVTNGVVLGASGLARIGWIGVHPEYQGNGIGKALIHEVINQCRAQKCHKITLYTTDDRVIEIPGSVIGAPYAMMVRDGHVDSIDLIL